MTHSTHLAPDFQKRLRQLGITYNQATMQADCSQWQIANEVAKNWKLYKGKTKDGFTAELMYANKGEYYTDCTLVIKAGMKKPLFDSERTLRSYCEMAEFYNDYYEEMKDRENLYPVEYYLENLSFKHLEEARKLHKDGKVVSLFEALKYALGEEDGQTHTYKEMVYRFDPSDEKATPAERRKADIDRLLDVKSWSGAVAEWKVPLIIEKIKEVKEVIERKSK